MKRFIAMAVAAVVMASGFVVPVMGGSLPTPTPVPHGWQTPGTILIQNVPPGVRVEGIRVLDMTANANFTRMAYTINPRFEGFFASRNYNGTPITTGRLAVAYINSLVPNPGGTVEEQDQNNPLYVAFASDVRQYILDNGIDWDREQDAPIGPNGTVSWTDLPLGHYMVFAGAQTSVIANLTSTTPDVCIRLKGDTIEVDKIVTNPTAGVGEIRVYEVSSTVPDMSGFTTFTWILHDEMSAGLTFNDDVRMYIDGTAVPAAAFNVVHGPSAHAANPGGTAIQITLTNAHALFSGSTIGDDVLLRYSATINDNAVVGVPGNPNTVRIEYSNDRFNNTQTGSTVIDDDSTATVFTFDLQLLKVDYLDNTMTLENAVFSLYTTTHPTDGEGNPIANAPSRVHEDGTTIFLITNTLRSDANGVVRWMRDDNGVESDYDIKIGEGTFYLIETQAPMGFFLMDEPIIFTVNATVNGNVLEGMSVVGDGFTYNHNTGIISRTIVNYGLDDGLPYTGGIGRTIFMTVGGVVILGSLAGMLIANKKKKVGTQ